jgi:hypothetical protein
MTGEPVELAPAHRAFSLAGWVGLAFDAAGLAVALFVVRRPVPMLGFFAVNGAVSAAISLVTWRRGLRRVVAPLPHRAVVVPGRFPGGRLAGSMFATATTLVLAGLGIVSPAVLGAGVGAEVGLLWSARKIGEFEREDGRRILRATRRRLGEPALYAA